MCVGASSVLEAGAYLDAVLVLQGPSSSTPVLLDSQDEETGGAGITGGGLKYGMSGGSAEGTLVMSEWVNTDDYGWTKVRFVGRMARFPFPFVLGIWGGIRDYVVRGGVLYIAHQLEKNVVII